MSFLARGSGWAALALALAAVAHAQVSDAPASTSETAAPAEAMVPPADARLVTAPGSAVRAAVWTRIEEGRPANWYALDTGTGSFGEAKRVGFELHLRYGKFDPLVSTPVVPPHLDANLGGRLWIVQYWTPATEAWREAVRAAGGTIRHVIPDTANIVEMDGYTAARLQQSGFVRWVGSFHPAYKLDDALLAEQVRGSGPATRTVNILSMVPGEAGQLPIVARIAAIGGRVDQTDEYTSLMRATLGTAQIAEIARMDEVQWMDPWAPPGEDMDIARQFHGAVYVETLGFDGTGVRGEVLDGGTQLNHPEFTPAPIAHGSVPSASHGTSTYGQVFANGNNAQAKGILHNGQGIVGNYSAFSGGSRFAHTAELINPTLNYQACFQSNSWGGAQVTTYTATSQQMDDILFRNDILILNSQSNTGNQTSRPEAWAKNIMSVGGINHLNTLTKADDSWGGASIGPAADGRLKPDIASFYDNIFTTTTTSTYTSSFGGTSGATPICAGMSGLFFQMWQQELFGNASGFSAFSSRPRAALAKAFIINTATQWTFSGAAHNLTRTHQGWGHPDAQKLYDSRAKIFWVNETDILAPLASTVRTFSVAAGEAEFEATMTWQDPPGNPAVLPHRVNNLDLKVTAPNGTIYWGNNGLAAGMVSTAGGTPNTVDTVENVIIANPDPGTWTVEVIAAQINQDGCLETPAVDADYALVVRGVTNPGPFARPLGLSLSTVAGTGSAFIGVNGIPAGTVEGYCVFSNTTPGLAGGGSFYGITPDVLTLSCFVQPAVPGSLLHWTWPSPGTFPAVPFNLPPGSVPFPPGSSTDGIVIAIGPGFSFVEIGAGKRVTW